MECEITFTITILFTVASCFEIKMARPGTLIVTLVLCCFIVFLKKIVCLYFVLTEPKNT